MERIPGKVLFLGSIPGDSATEVLRMCAEETGDCTSCLPDGETGNRSQWIQGLAANVYSKHPSIITLHSPAPKDGKERWHNEAYNEQGWQFKIKEGVTQIRFEELGYAAAAIASYKDFCALRNTGVIHPQTRFQISLPLTESATRIFLTNAADYEIMKEAFEEAMIRELHIMLAAIPASDLVIQWDMALEVLYAILEGKTPWAPAGNAYDRLMDALNVYAAHIPEETILGCHLCYGDLGHKHLVEPTDLALAVNMANELTKHISRRIDYFHMPVPRNRNDEAYFAPLSGLDANGAKLYLGLVHLTDGVEGAKGRINAAKKYVTGFGIATECGMGRRPKEHLQPLLRIHREAAAEL